MPFWLQVLLFIASLLVVVLMLRQIRRRRLARRLMRVSTLSPVDGLTAQETLQEYEESERPFVRRHYVVCLLVGVSFALACQYAVGLKWPYSVASGTWAWVLALQADLFRMTLLQRRIESQLSRAIDSLVAALRAGAALPLALTRAEDNMPSPLFDQFHDVNQRIRLGEQPARTMERLMQRVPLESFNLFAVALAVHWELGGSLSEPLSSVGRTIRDRILIGRRITAAAIQSRLSAVAIILVTYMILIIMYVSDRETVGNFLATTTGQYLVSGSVILQAVGVLVIGQLSKMRV